MPTPGSSYPPAADTARGPGRPGRLVVVRHGTTAWSRAGRHTGRTDVPLLTDGEHEAEVIGLRLQGHSFARVLTSPLSRARDTCALAGFGDQAQVCEDLAEWDYGAYEGLTTAQIRAERPDWQLWIDGVVGGETLEELSRRADKVVARARADAEAGDVIAFAHGHILRVVCARWLAMAATEASRFVLSPGAMGVLGWEHETAAVVCWNDTGTDPLGA